MSIVENQRRCRIFAAIFLAAIPLLYAPATQASGWQQDVEQRLLIRWQEISGHESDSALSFPGLPADYQLPDCEGGFDLALVKPLQAGRNGLELSCNTPYWKQHLAVQLHIYKAVAVLRKPVSAGQPLTADDISMVRHDTGELTKGYYLHPEDVQEQISRRSLRAGTVLSPDMLDPPVIINRGERVKIRVNRPGIRIEMNGTALENGRQDERIRVRNEQSQKIVHGRVAGRGLVQVE
jgi:flagella basal body P-ring formation protein FlgA